MNLSNRSIIFAPITIFFSIIIVVLATFFVSRDEINSQQQLEVKAYSDNIYNSTNGRLNLIEEMLYAGVGLFTVNENVTKQDWQKFVSATQITQRYPGTQGIGYVKVLKDSEVESFELDAKTSISSDFVVRPSGDRSEYSVITHLEPQDERNIDVVGYDMNTEQKRRTAMDSARDSGEVYLSDAVNLIGLEPEGDQVGVLMYAPQYSLGKPTNTIEERREAIEGYVYAVFKTESFFNDLSTNNDLSSISYEILSSDGDLRLNKSSNYDEIKSQDHSNFSDNFSIDGVSFEFNFVYFEDKLLPESSESIPLRILIFGSLAALIIAGATYLLLSFKSNQLLLSKERDINDAKDNLLSIASHQLRTPATGVKQYLGMVLQGFAGDVSPHQNTLLQKAYESNERQLKTINDVLYLARLDSGRITLTNTIVDLQAMIESVVEELRDRIDENQHRISLVFPKSKLSIKADEHVLRMVVENLLTNAIKYTKNKGKITVKLKRSSGIAILQVSDNGIGIRSEDKQLLFRQFSRIPNELSKTVSGTGIGLYLVKHLLMLHSATIEIESSLKKGSTFTVKLPIKPKKQKHD